MKEVLIIGKFITEPQIIIFPKKGLKRKLSIVFFEEALSSPADLIEHE
jgi:hypothetical protein